VWGVTRSDYDRKECGCGESRVAVIDREAIHGCRLAHNGVRISVRLMI